jgi:pullulanase-type alpha-1,6-glucosidase
MIVQNCTGPDSSPQTSQSNGTITGAAAHWVSADRIIWDAPEDAASYRLYFSDTAGLIVTDTNVNGEEFYELTPNAELSNSLAAKFRHISDRPVFSLRQSISDIDYALEGQLLAVALNDEGEPIDATKVQIHGVLDDLYLYDGDLGPVYDGNSISLSLWAPTAQSVTLNLYNGDKELIEKVDPIGSAPANGVWTFEGGSEWDRMYYTFNIRVYHHESGFIEEYEVTDPYSVSLSTDSRQSQFVNLNNSDLKPTGWDSLIKPLPEHSDITLYEAHMRDFSMNDLTVPEEHRGTYMAFTHNGESDRDLSDAMSHLQQLSDAGLTHLHLLPLNDIASIHESREERVDLSDPFERICEVADVQGLDEACAEYGTTTIEDVFDELASDDPVTQEIQRIIAQENSDGGHAFASTDGFNWGYDPFHFNTPEGSYSTDPEGTARILELRRMVQALDEIDLYIVVDVVYNHTHATGGNRFSVLDKVVPGYYQRLNPDTGQVETSTCCSNTAAEFAMMEKLIIDSVKLWAEQYKIDSFRFDLMGHHPKSTMINVQNALAELTTEEHGVHGDKIYLYGEGWNFGEVADDRIFTQATQFNMGGTGIGNFNDRSRDAIRGGFHSWTGREQGFANGRYLYPNEEATASSDEQRQSLLDQADRIRVGMTGNLATYPYINKNGNRVDGSNDYIGYALNPVESVNYIDKHDNETLWDNTQTKLPEEMTMDERVRVHLLSQAFINYGLGVPFHQMGTDILRSKSTDRNSYDSGDWYNRVDFTLETDNWAIGLPPAWDNESNWEAQTEFMTNPNIDIRKEHMEFANRVFRDQLRVRYSTPLLRLGDADEIHNRVGYHNTGPNQVPGLILMTISDGSCTSDDLDPEIDGVLIVLNADLEPQEIDLGIDGLQLHTALQNGADQVVKESIMTNGTITVPPISAAVFIKPQSVSQGSFPCNPVME